MSILTPLMKISKFMSDAAGLEKTLRLIQSICQVVAAYMIGEEDAAAWLTARRQLALGRRYLRILKFTDAFASAFASFGPKANTGLIGYLEFGKWSFLGMYLLLESITILDTMGVYPASWATTLFFEAMKFWFYSLVMSIAITLMQLFKPQTGPAINEKVTGEKKLKSKAQAEKQRRARKIGLMRNLAADFCDIFIPGTVTGWMALSFAGVGWVSVASTLLAGWDIWVRVQKS